MMQLLLRYVQLTIRLVYKSKISGLVVDIILLPLSAILVLFRRKSFVLMYHCICDEKPDVKFNKALYTTRVLFERQLALLDLLGYEQLGNADILSREGYHITSDDGYIDTFDVFASSSKVTKKPTIFHCTALAKKGSTWWESLERAILEESLVPHDFDSLAKNHRENAIAIIVSNGSKLSKFLSIRDILLQVPLSDIEKVFSRLDSCWGRDREVYHRGFCILSSDHSNFANIQGHTASHISLPAETTRTVVMELQACDDEIEKATGYRVSEFAYTYGLKNVSGEVEAVLKQRYERIYTTSYGFIDATTDKQEIPRISVSNDDGLLRFFNKTSGSYAILYWIYDGFTGTHAL